MAAMRLSRIILLMNSTAITAAVPAQSTVVSMWLRNTSVAPSTSTGQRRRSPSTTSNRPSRNTGRNAIASISPTIRRV